MQWTAAPKEFQKSCLGETMPMGIRQFKLAYEIIKEYNKISSDESDV
jgi:hypothetical protein